MLVTITCRGPEASDLSYLLHKNPSKINTFDLKFGRAVVFYPVVSAETVTCAMMLDIDPLFLAKEKGQKTASQSVRQSGLFDYISDRPYASTSFLSVALARVFNTAKGGRCSERPEAVDRELDLTAQVFCLPCEHDDKPFQFFEPLGYEVSLQRRKSDGFLDFLGANPYVNLTIRGRVVLSKMIQHLYILIPVFGGRKHYFVGDDEVDKLLRLGGDWLKTHPFRDEISSLYLSRFRYLTALALERLEDGEAGATEEVERSAKANLRPRLSKERLEVILHELRLSGARSVLDLGCGEGRLLLRMANEKMFERIIGLDISTSALKKAEERLFKAFKGHPSNLTLIQGALTYADSRLKGFDAAVCQEVVEHLDAWRLPIFQRVLFEYIRPKTVILTTPNVEYNVRFPSLTENKLRHEDHRFEFSRAEFAQWATKAAESYGYAVRVSDLGESDARSGRPTQMGVFSLCG
ncbi:MAG: 3' terminal RNA ribose 2'-O-methyltransferase Hen1 [Deltaproteobacteria bacterium]|jgi:3' terminal RNA ribose 2'-O-methyltransferase Hen1|nr:3' terminal RNA ribose 2'-O-methyltransferase Hen1 [Deltaproteobacteria bacterium]